MSATKEKTVKVTINGAEHEVPASWSVFKAAAHAGIDIPHLCHHPRLPPAGKCGICVVEIEGFVHHCTF